MSSSLYGAPGRPIIPMSPQGAQFAAVQQQAQLLEDQLGHVQDHMQLEPLMATASFKTDSEGWIREGTRRSLFVDNEGQSQSSGIVQHKANSTFGGARLGDEDWVLDGLGVYVRRKGTRGLTCQDEAELRWSTHLLFKRAENEQSIGNLGLWPAGDKPYFDYSAVRFFKEKVPVPARKHFSMKLSVLEDFQLSQPGTIYIHTIFLGTKSVSPIDRAGA